MRQVSILAALLAVGCAHGKSEAKTAKTTKAGDESVAEQRAEHRDHQLAEKADHAARADEVERVEMPEASPESRARMANAGTAIPADAARDAPRDAQQQRAPENAAAYGAPPDNTRVNERDRESSSLTPMDQKENESDLKITQRIRKAVVANDALSFTAKNVKIITRDGQVTLRGSVKKAEEKSAIEKAARDVAGPGKVNNEIEVAD